MVAIFKTDVYDARTAKLIVRHLLFNFPAYRINFDLDDCDKILRVEGEEVTVSVIGHAMAGLGFLCEELE